MKNILTLDKLPYFFTLLIGVCAYIVQHVADYIMEAPTVCYEYTILNTKDSLGDRFDHLQIEITNLNRSVGFNNLGLDVEYSSTITLLPAEVMAPELIPVAPARILNDTVAHNHRLIKNMYFIPRLNPGGKYLARMTLKHNQVINDFPKVYLDCKDNIWFTEVSLEVWLARHYLKINLILLSTLFIILFFYALLLVKKTTLHEKTKI